MNQNEPNYPSTATTLTTTFAPAVRPCHDPCIFVLGCDRSGTTLVQKLLSSHRDLHVTYECAFPVMVRHLYRPNNFEPVLQALDMFPLLNVIDIDGLRDDLRAHAPASFSDLVALLFRRVAALKGKTRWGDKTPAYTRHILPLAAMFPAARFLHVVRDPRAVAMSFVPANWGPNTFWHAGRTWADAVAIATADMDLLEPWRSRTIKFEDVVREPERTLRGVCDFLDLAWDPDLLKTETRQRDDMPSVRVEVFHKKARKDIDPKRAESWQRLDPRRFRHLEAMCWDLMDLYGYEHTCDAPVPPTRFEQFQYKVANRLLSYGNAIRKHASGDRPPKYPIYG